MFYLLDEAMNLTYMVKILLSCVPMNGYFIASFVWDKAAM